MQVVVLIFLHINKRTVLQFGKKTVKRHERYAETHGHSEHIDNPTAFFIGNYQSSGQRFGTAVNIVLTHSTLL